MKLLNSVGHYQGYYETQSRLNITFTKACRLQQQRSMPPAIQQLQVNHSIFRSLGACVAVASKLLARDPCISVHHGYNDLLQHDDCY